MSACVPDDLWQHAVIQSSHFSQSHCCELVMTPAGVPELLPFWCLAAKYRDVCTYGSRKKGIITQPDLYIWTRSISVQCSTAWTEAALLVLCFDLLLILDAFFGKVPWGWWQCLQVVSRGAAVGLGWANAHTFISAQPRAYAAHVSSFPLSCAVMSNILTFFLCYLLLRITSVVKKKKPTGI